MLSSFLPPRLLEPDPSCTSRAPSSSRSHHTTTAPKVCRAFLQMIRAILTAIEAMTKEEKPGPGLASRWANEHGQSPEKKLSGLASRAWGLESHNKRKQLQKWLAVSGLMGSLRVLLLTWRTEDG